MSHRRVKKSQWLCLQKPKETWLPVKETWEQHQMLHSRQSKQFSCSIAHVRQAWLVSLVVGSVNQASKQPECGDGGGEAVSVGHGWVGRRAVGGLWACRGVTVGGVTRRGDDRFEAG